MISYQAAREKIVEATVLRSAASPKAVASALALVLLVGLLPWVARADSTTTYDFSGTLAKSGMVTGQFTLDAANIRITSFHFTTPLGDITAPSSNANIYIYTPASSPAKNFVEIEILPTVSNPGLNLNFQADLSNLTPSSFYPGSFYLFPNMPSAPSQLMPPVGCTDCEGFTAGSVVVVKPGGAPPKPDDSSQQRQDLVGEKAGGQPRKATPPRKAL